MRPTFTLVFGLVLSGGGAGAQTLPVELLWEYGTVEGAPETLWESIRDAAIVGDDVFVLDGLQGVIRRFTLEGVLLKQFGRLGDGPGEFTQSTELRALGDTAVVVFDLLQRRWTTFDTSGSVLGTRPAPVPVGAGMTPFHVLWAARGGWLVGETAVTGGHGDSASGWKGVLTWAQGSDSASVLAEFSGNGVTVVQPGSTLRRTGPTVLGADGGSWLFGDSILAVVSGEEQSLSLYRFGPDGPSLHGTVPLPAQREPLTDSDRDDIWQDTRTIAGRVRFESPEFPEAWPAWRGVAGSPDGHLWLKRGGREVGRAEVLEKRWPGDEWERIDLSAPEDRQTVYFPPGVQAVHFDRGYVVARRKDELDVQHLQLYRIGEEGIPGPDP